MLSLIYNKKGIAIYKELFATLNIGMPNKDTMLFWVVLVIYGSQIYLYVGSS